MSNTINPNIIYHIDKDNRYSILRYLAVGGRHHERAIITVFDLASSKKVKTLQTDAGLEDIDCMAFSDGEEKYVL